MLTVLKKHGKKELHNNLFFCDLNELMQSDTKFRIFYDKYFKDSSDVQTVILYLKLYETLEIEYKQYNNNEKVDEDLLIYAIKELMSNESTRKNILSSFDRYNQHKNNNTNKNKNKNKNKYLLDIISQIKTIMVQSQKLLEIGDISKQSTTPYL